LFGHVGGFKGLLLVPGQRPQRTPGTGEPDRLCGRGSCI